MLDKTMPKDKWEFDKDVTKVFDNMLSRSIPQYNVMRDLVVKWSENYIKNNEVIIDLGSSRGEAIKSLMHLGNKNDFIATEISEPMLEELLLIPNTRNNIHVYNWDLRFTNGCLHKLLNTTKFESKKIHLITSVLTLMFVPMEHRQNLLKCVYECLEDDGAFIIVEKILGSTPETNETMVEQYLLMKEENGYTTEEIDRKKTSLEGVLVPLTIEQNELLFKNAGFKTSEIFWKWNNFTAWICTK
jgi:tRNA (cmo5U34)-methyltransferase